MTKASNASLVFRPSSSFIQATKGDHMKTIGRILLVVVILAALAGAGKLGYDRFVVEPKKAAAATTNNIQLIAARKGTLTATVSTTGQLVAVTQAKLSFRTAGILKELNVQVGSTVKAGDVLAKLDTTDLESALAQAQLNLQSSQIKYQQLQQAPDANDIIVAKNNLEKAAIAVQKAQSDYDKISWRGNVGMTSQAAALQQATLDYQTAQANYNKATQSSTTALDLEAAQDQIKLSQLQVDQAKRNLDNATLVAPFDGVVASVGANLGEAVGTNTVMVTLVNLKGLRIDTNIDETDIGKVAVSQPVSITLDALPSVTLKGQVSAISPSATVQSGVVTYLVQIVVQTSNPQLRAGLTANANIVVQQKENVLLVPNRAIKVTRNQRTVQVMENGQLVETQIQTGMSNDQYTEVTNGLTEGEQVAITTTATNQPISGGLGGIFGGGGTTIRVPSGGGR
jgi:HlyD family secretion protein